MNYKLVSATENEIDLLIKYKLASIFDYAYNLDENETNKIKEYINNTVPEELNDYKLIKINDEIVGCLLIEPYEDGVLLNEIYLTNDYRGKGIGTDILNDILSNNEIVYLWAYKNNVRAIKLYKKLGFNVIEETDTRVFMKYEN